MVNKKKLKTNPFATKDKKVKKLEDIKIDTNGVTNTSTSNNTYNNNPNHNILSNSSNPMGGITKSLDANFNNQTVSSSNSHAKNEDIRVSNNLDKYHSSNGISSDMLFGSRKSDEQFNSKLDKMGAFTAIGSDMMKNDAVQRSGNAARCQHDEDTDTKDKIINLYRSVKNSAYNFISQSISK